MRTRRPKPRAEPRHRGRTLVAVLVSVLLHALVAGSVWQLARHWQPLQHRAQIEPIRIQFRPDPDARPTPSPPQSAPVMADTSVPPPKSNPRQIVDLTQREAEPVKPTDLLAAQNARANQEMIARNLGRTENQAASSDDQPDLPAEPAPAGDGGEAGQIPDQQRLGRGPLSSERDSRRSGTAGRARALVPQISDLLSGEYSAQANYINREQGPVTLLNARSSPFAGYLIDAGHSVVRYLNINGSLMSWYFEDVQNLKLPLEARMRVGRSGEITQSGLTHSSGSVKVDQWFLDALRSGFTGKAPPQEIFREGAEDFVIVGMFHLDHIAVGIP